MPAWQTLVRCWAADVRMQSNPRCPLSASEPIPVPLAAGVLYGRPLMWLFLMNNYRRRRWRHIFAARLTDYPTTTTKYSLNCDATANIVCHLPNWHTRLFYGAVEWRLRTRNMHNTLHVLNIARTRSDSVTLQTMTETTIDYTNERLHTA